MNLTPLYISKLFALHDKTVNLCGDSRLTMLRVNTTHYGLHSFVHQGSKLRKSLPNDISIIMAKQSKFKSVISNLNLVLTAVPSLADFIRILLCFIIYYIMLFMSYFSSEMFEMIACLQLS